MNKNQLKKLIDKKHKELDVLNNKKKEIIEKENLEGKLKAIGKCTFQDGGKWTTVKKILKYENGRFIAFSITKHSNFLSICTSDYANINEWDGSLNDYNEKGKIAFCDNLIFETYLREFNDKIKSELNYTEK